MTIEIPTTKRCNHCKEAKPFVAFCANRRMKDGRSPRCRECMALEKKEHYIKNREKYFLKHKKYREENKETLFVKKSEWFQKNKTKIQEKRKVEHTVKYWSDPVYKFKFLIRSRIRNAIKQGRKTGSAIRDLGCSSQFAVQYIASKFKTGMSWENHGEWHIDHIRPLSSFNLQDRAEYLKAVHYTNLQPLWAKDNLRKATKI